MTKSLPSVFAAAFFLDPPFFFLWTGCSEYTVNGCSSKVRSVCERGGCGLAEVVGLKGVLRGYVGSVSLNDRFLSFVPRGCFLIGNGFASAAIAAPVPHD